MEPEPEQGAAVAVAATHLIVRVPFSCCCRM